MVAVQIFDFRIMVAVDYCVAVVGGDICLRFWCLGVF